MDPLSIYFCSNAVVLGTGKSFVGALCAKILLEQPQVKVLVNCFTNHALDQFLEDLMDIGIPKREMVRIGGKSTPRTAPLSLQTLGRSVKCHPIKNEMKTLYSREDALNTELDDAFMRYKSFNPGFRDVIQHLTFDHPEFAAAFYVPASEDDSIFARKDKKPIETEPFYLLRRWYYGQNAGIFHGSVYVKAAKDIWGMDRQARQACYEGWKQELVQEQIEYLYGLGQTRDEWVDQLGAQYRLGESHILQTRRVIGCTTTGAAKYR